MNPSARLMAVLPTERPAQAEAGTHARQVFSCDGGRPGLSAAESAAMMAEELELESSLMRAIPGARERLERARATGARTVFLSDMYVDAAFVRDQLARHGISGDGGVYYVSCDTGHGKQDGSAYRRGMVLAPPLTRSVIKLALY